MIQSWFSSVCRLGRQYFLPLPETLVCCFVGEQMLAYDPHTQQITTLDKTNNTPPLRYDEQAETGALLPLATHPTAAYAVIVPDYMVVGVHVETGATTDGIEKDTQLQHALPIASPLYESLTNQQTHYLVANGASLRSVVCEQLVAVFTTAQARQLWLNSCIDMQPHQVFVFMDTDGDKQYLSCFCADGSLAYTKHEIGLSVYDALVVATDAAKAEAYEYICCEKAANGLPVHSDNVLKARKLEHTEYSNSIPKMLNATLVSRQDLVTLSPTAIGGILASGCAPNRWLHACQYHKRSWCSK